MIPEVHQEITIIIISQMSTLLRSSNIPLQVHVDKLYTGDIRVFNNPSFHFPSIPPSTLCIWIYGEDNKAITTIVAFQDSHVIHIHTSINPCVKRMLYNKLLLIYTTDLTITRT